MDEHTRRATVEAVAQHVQDGRLDQQDWARHVLDQYEDLKNMADEIAKVVWSLRWPRAYEPSFEIDFGEAYIDTREPMVTASFYMHQSNDSFRFPQRYLFMSYDEIVTAEDILKDEAAAAEAAIRREAREEQRRRDLANLKRLREQYPDA
jgi:hypothetical protein